MKAQNIPPSAESAMRMTFEQGREALRQQQELRAPTGEDRAHHHLAFDADIPQAGAEGDDQTDADQGERDPEVEDAAQLAAVFEGAFPEGVDDIEGVAADSDDQRRRDRQRDGDGQEQEADLDGKGAWGFHARLVNAQKGQSAPMPSSSTTSTF